MDTLNFLICQPRYANLPIIHAVAMPVFMFNLSLTLILFFTLSSPRPFHYGTPFHPISCFPPLYHLLNVICTRTYISFNVVICVIVLKLVGACIYHSDLYH